MSWGAVAGAAVSIGASYLGSKGASDSADAQLDLEREFRQKEMDLANNQFDFAKGQYQDYKDKFDPLFYDIRGMMDDTEPDYGAIAGDVNMAFEAQRGADQRNMRRYGIRPDDGAARAANRDWGIRQAAAHVGTRSAARQGAKDKRYGRYADLYNAGQGIGTQNASMVTGAMANQQAAARSGANAASNNANMYNNMAYQNAQGWGQAVGSVDWGGIFNQAKGWFNNRGGSKGGPVSPNAPTVPR